MSGAMVEKLTKIIICDICGKEITDKEKEDKEATARLVGWYGANEAAVVELPKHKLLKFNWPSYQKRDERRKEIDPDRDSLYERRRDYDLHSECVAGLLDAAVDMRVAREEQKRKTEETVAKRNARIIAEAERKAAAK